MIEIEIARKMGTFGNIETCLKAFLRQFRVST
jgi:hypothetical protein